MRDESEDDDGAPEEDGEVNRRIIKLLFDSSTLDEPKVSQVDLSIRTFQVISRVHYNPITCFWRLY